MLGKHSLSFCAAAALPAFAMLLYSHIVLGGVTALGQGQAMRVGARPWEGLAGVLVSPARGLFVFSPVLLLGLAYLPRTFSSRARHPVVPYLAVGSLLLVGLHGIWHVWWGGVSYGYRMLIETLPAFMLLLAVAWETHLRGRPVRVAAAGALLLFSVWTSALGALVAPCGFDMDPVPVDQHPERLWEVRGTELVRCTQRALGMRASR